MYEPRYGGAMTARFCTHCGAPLAPGSAFCSSCGSPVEGSVPAPTYGTPAAGVPTAFPYPGAPLPPAPYLSSAAYGSARYQAADGRALSTVSTAAILAIVGTILSFATLFTTPALSLLGDASSGSSVSTGVAVAVLFGVLLSASLAISLVQLWLFRSAFSDLAPIDSRFSTPRTLVLVAMIGFVLVLLGFVGLIVVVFQPNTCTSGGSSATSPCVNLGASLGFLALLAVGGITVFVGYIGLLVGIWRLGTRYDEGLFKAAAILLILIPFVGAILLLIAARSSRKRMTAGPVAQPFG